MSGRLTFGNARAALQHGFWAMLSTGRRPARLAMDRYKLGIDPYLNVISAQTTLLSNKQTLVNLQIQQSPPA